MIRDLHDNYVTDTPLVHEDQGELSLHFGFPTIQSRMLKADPARLVLDYTRTMMGFLLFQPRPERIAMIGLGGGSLAKYCRLKLPDSDFTAIEISPEVIALRKAFAVPEDGSRFRIVCADGADFMRRKIETFDVLLLDGFDSGGQPGQLCTSAFYDHCHAALRAGGIFVVNLCADDPACSSHIARIDESFYGKTLVVEADEGENKIVFSCKGASFPPTFKELTERLRALEAAHPVELERTAQKILRREQARRGGRKRRR
ncbi:MAG: fused MFS/spermidine synthase [Propionivibrio sp.]|uniref:fused MFS/spermidine synthase n=1 Tax=Propionivibrio sp. TaxID=2212460 RepID=UPI001A51A7D6|nr:fused MFS/spermidine synthase [Propionivibrio sp.]MBL8413255.1 fused MFS/spermidine synthase [Propionivibrio sp.]